MQVSESNHFYGFLDLCSLQKFMEFFGPVVTWLLNATLIRSGHVFNKCKASQVASIRSVGISCDCDVLKVEINYDKLWNMTMESANVQNAMDKVFYDRVHPLTMSKIVHYRRICPWIPVAQIHFI